MNGGTAAWARERERGGRLVLRLMIRLSLGLGQPVGEALLTPITLWFLAASPGARAASRSFLARALGRPARAGEVWRHFRCFASVILDRVFLLAGRGGGFELRVKGLAALEAALAGGRGALLLGSHLGSFEILLAFAAGAPAPVRALMYRANAGALSALLAELDRARPAGTIDIGAPEAMLEVREALARGEIVALLADRSPATDRQVLVPFLGAPAAFPTGPFLLAAILEAPVLLCWGIRLGPRRYQIRFEPFAERLVLERGERAPALEAVVARYAGRLAAMARRHPCNWFNFFPFWEQPRNAGGPPR